MWKAGTPFANQSAFAHFVYIPVHVRRFASLSPSSSCAREVCESAGCYLIVGQSGELRLRQRRRRLVYTRLENIVCYFRRYDNLTVTLQHDTENQGHFCTLLARGSPYMTFEFAGATPRIKSNGDILEVFAVPVAYFNTVTCRYTPRR